MTSETNKRSRFWAQVQAELRDIPLAFKKERKVPLLNGIDCYQISFQSLGNETIYGFLLLPQTTKACPLVIEFLGYMNYLQEPFQFAHWPLIGCGCLVIDNRGQGGKTQDHVPYETTQHELPFGRGILEKEDFYMKRLIADSLRTLEVAQALTEVNQDRVILRGGSQGGGVALWVNALAASPIFATFADVPSHSNILNRMVQKTGSYSVVQDYCIQHPTQAAQIQDVMGYYDLQYVAHQITGPVFASVGSKDPICPMTDFFVSYKKILAPKQLMIYLNKGHGGGEAKQIRREMQQIKKLLAKDEQKE
ncbi:acetylxylan esterase [Enterococcus sp. RIT-PI-f]|uniref:acetylxylan esterase n=1 Tax=Enterococcus sp. RIT-PI-f TaxID=1690244 RepID=UPI0006B90B80|nr:acetylxylan esterase [Enterococcus sp. RIT-PI-f]KPG70484.1 acetyl xylan esterase [Enterococcus sp. RIT-PI-f]